jgi:hypothetical protein
MRVRCSRGRRRAGVEAAAYEQVRDLGRLVELASRDRRAHRVDQLTDVTLYRVGALGQFAAKSVELRPGTYTAIGSRDGYRDVRRTFTIVPGRDLPSISVTRTG